MTGPVFLPWLRQGLARGVGTGDDLGPLPLRGTLTGRIDLGDSEDATARAEVPLRLAGPGDAVGIDPAFVVRTVPADGATEVEANFLPFAELAAPDLPWVLTPAQPTAANQLRPWLVLVCVEQRDGVGYDPLARPLPLLSLAAEVAAQELPDLSESWAWVHVQSIVPAGQVAEQVEQATGAVLARLLCPRHLLDGRTYRAAVVPAFSVGVAAGKGEDTSGITSAEPAWDIQKVTDAVELPVYLSWTFTTATEPGDFEALASRLQPDTTGGRMGYHRARLDGSWLLEPYRGDTSFEYAGALVDPDSGPAELDRKARAWFESGLAEALQWSADRATVPRQPPAGYDPETDDPVLGPPYYGSWAADHYQAPEGGWLQELNLTPQQRAAAGLGAEVVRRHQHEFLAAAWDQVGDLRALREELNRGRLAAEVGRSLAERFAGLPDESLLLATERLHVFAEVADTTVAQRLRSSAVMPAAMISPGFARQTRPASTLARRAGRNDSGPAVGARTVERFTAASVQGRTRAEEAVARFGAPFVARGTVTATTSFQLVDIGGGVSTDLVAVEPLADLATTAADDVTPLAAAVRRSLDPMRAVVAGLASRVSGVRLDPAADLPTRIVVGPRFPDPLFRRMRQLGTELVLPGVEDFASNRVRLLEVNEGWVAAFLAGANHEWAREALWNEYPADLGATAFAAFWPRVPAGAPDLRADLHTWPLDDPLDAHVGGAGGSTVLLVRGDLIRRHPDAEFLLVTPAADGAIVDAAGNLPPDRVAWPDFTGRIDRETLFVGFDVDPDAIRKEGRYLGIQEPVAGPRFGLDQADSRHHGTRPPRWSDLSWGHVADSAATLATLTHISLAGAPWLAGQPIDGLRWARNSAHLAGITFQRPFRLLLPAASLMPPPERRR